MRINSNLQITPPSCQNSDSQRNSHLWDVFTANSTPGFENPLWKFIYFVCSAILIIAFVIKLVGFIISLGQPNINDFQYTELLINFEGGFVRRGLVGQILFYLSQFFNCSPILLINIGCIGCFIGILCFLLYKFRLKGLCWWLILTPFLCGYTSCIIRKDFLCYLIIICILYSIRTSPLKGINMFWASLLVILGLFVHEAFIFYGFPFMALYCIRFNKSVFKYISILMVIVMFLILCYFKGGPQTPDLIVDSWNTLYGNDFLKHESWNSIGALGWPLDFAVNFHLHANFYNPVIGWWQIFVRILTLIICYIFFINYIWHFEAKNSDKGYWSARCTIIGFLFLFSIICLLPMFTVLSCDYPRLYQYAFMATLLPYLTIPVNRLQELIGASLSRCIVKINERLIIKGKFGIIFCISIMLSYTIVYLLKSTVNQIL